MWEEKNRDGGGNSQQTASRVLPAPGAWRGAVLLTESHSQARLGRLAGRASSKIAWYVGPSALKIPQRGGLESPRVLGGPWTRSFDTSSEITKKTCALAVYGACSLLLSVLSKPLSQFSLCDLPFPRVCITSLLGQMAAAEYRQLEVGSCLS